MCFLLFREGLNMANNKFKSFFKAFAAVFSLSALLIGLLITGVGGQTETSPTETTEIRQAVNGPVSVIEPKGAVAQKIKTAPEANTSSSPIEASVGETTGITIITDSNSGFTATLDTQDFLPVTGYTNLTSTDGYAFHIPAEASASSEYGYYDLLNFKVQKCSGSVTTLTIIYNDTATTLASYYMYLKATPGTLSFSGTLTSTVAYSATNKLSSATIVASASPTNGGSAVEGNWKFSSVAIPNAGTYSTYQATFTATTNPTSYKALTATVSSLTVSKGTIGTPSNTLTMTARSSSSITVSTASVEGYGDPLYAISTDPTNFQSSGVFSGLSSGTEYQFYYCYSANSNYSQSASSAAFTFKTLIKEDGPSGATPDYLGGHIVNLVDGGIYCLTIGNANKDTFIYTADSEGHIPYYDTPAYGFWGDYTLSIYRKARSSDYEDSVAYDIAPASRPAAPLQSSFTANLTSPEGTRDNPSVSYTYTGSETLECKIGIGAWGTLAPNGTFTATSGATLTFRKVSTSVTVPASSFLSFKAAEVLPFNAANDGVGYIDYTSDSLTSLLENTEYCWTYNSIDYAVVSSSSGTIPLVGTDKNGVSYDLHGVSVSISRSSTGSSYTNSLSVSYAPGAYVDFTDTLSYESDANNPGKVLVTIVNPSYNIYLISTDGGKTFSENTTYSFYVDAGASFLIRNKGSGISPTDSSAYALGNTKTLTAPTIYAVPQGSIDYPSEKITGLIDGDSYTVTVGGVSSVYTAEGRMIAILESWFGQQISIVRNGKADGSVLASFAEDISIAARETGDFSSLSYVQDAETGRFIVTLSTDWDISVDGNGFNKVTSTSMYIYADHTIVVRVSATSSAPSSSNDFELTLPSIPSTPNAEADYVLMVLTGLDKNATYKINGSDVVSDGNGSVPLLESYLGTTVKIVLIGNTYVSAPQELSIKTADEAINAYIVFANGEIDDNLNGYSSPSSGMQSIASHYKDLVSDVANQTGKVSVRRNKIDGLVNEAVQALAFKNSQIEAVVYLDTYRSFYFSKADIISIIDEAQAKINQMVFGTNTVGELNDVYDKAILDISLRANRYDMDDKLDGAAVTLKASFDCSEEVKAAVQAAIDAAKTAVAAAQSVDEQNNATAQGIANARAAGFSGAKKYVKGEIESILALYPNDKGVSALVAKALADLDRLNSASAIYSDMKSIYDNLAVKAPLKVQEEIYDTELDDLKATLEDEYAYADADKAALENIISSAKASLGTAASLASQESIYNKAVSDAKAVKISGVNTASYQTSYPSDYDYSNGLSGSVEGDGVTSDSKVSVSYDVDENGTTGNTEYQYLADITVTLTDVPSGTYTVRILLPTTYSEMGKAYLLIDSDGNVIQGETDASGNLTFSATKSGSYKLVKSAARNADDSGLQTATIVLGVVLTLSVAGAVFVGLKFFKKKGAVKCTTLPLLAILAVSAGSLTILIVEIVLIVLVLAFVAYMLIKMRKKPEEKKTEEVKEEKAEEKK
jgi:hypothetical protein